MLSFLYNVVLQNTWAAVTILGVRRIKLRFDDDSEIKNSHICKGM